MVDRQGDPSGENRGITRRDALKRGAALTSALAWATPIVQVVGMRPALAHTPSPDLCHFHLVPSDPTADPICIEVDDSVCECQDACGGDPICEALCLLNATIIGIC